MINIEKSKIKYKGQWVFTTKEVADICGVNTNNIYHNVLYNRDKFIEGKHFFRVTGKECKAIADQHKNDVDIAGNSVTLWTKYGLLRLCKMSNSSRSWELLEEVADCNMKGSWGSRVVEWVKERIH